MNNQRLWKFIQNRVSNQTVSVGSVVLESVDFFLGNFTDLNSFQTIHNAKAITGKYQNAHSDALSGVLKKEFSETV
jgi:uncharacterized membrane protein